MDWTGRCVTVVGLGKSGVAAAQLLHRVGCRVAVTDERDDPGTRTAADGLAAQGIAPIELGRHGRETIAQSELVVVSPGVAETSAPMQWAMAEGLPIISEIELAFQHCPAPVIAVTGTNGKSSVVTLIARLFAAGGRRAIACGNIGVPFSSVVGQLSTDAVAVVEVSSFQLAWCETFRPKISVLLNMGINHLDRHPTRAEYMAAKSRIFQCQSPEDWAVLNGMDPDVVALSDLVCRAQRVWFGKNRTNPPGLQLASSTQRIFDGNAQAVVQVGRLAGLSDPLIWQTLREARGLEHRLEQVATVRGVTWINDSKSTTPESLCFALQRLPGPLVLILGGRDKGLNFELLTAASQSRAIKGYCLMGESRSRLRAYLNGAANVHEAETLDDAVSTAAAMAAPGDTVLFSPACASFDMFRNFEERGQAFRRLVHRLGNGVPVSAAS